jgi:MoaA/NifB/PqqE/SkfB family radical SAM enzyme
VPRPDLRGLDGNDLDDRVARSGARERVGCVAAVVEHTIARYHADFESGFVAESPDKLRRLPQYYAALAGDAPFPPVRCNAPWVSVVVEAKGQVRPCFFHKPIGSLRRAGLDAIVGTYLRSFRESLDVAGDPICTRCVCSLKTGWRHAPWQS